MTSPTNDVVLAAVKELGSKLDRLTGDVGLLKGRMVYDVSMQHANRIADGQGYVMERNLSIEQIDAPAPTPRHALAAP